MESFQKIGWPVFVAAEAAHLIVAAPSTWLDMLAAKTLSNSFCSRFFRGESKVGKSSGGSP